MLSNLQNFTNRDIIVKVRYDREHEYQEGEIISMHGLDEKDGEYKIVSSKQLDDSSVELRLELTK